MEEVIRLVKDHQLLSGGLTALLVGVIGIFANRKLQPKITQRQKVGKNSRGNQAGGDIKINSR